MRTILAALVLLAGGAARAGEAPPPDFVRLVLEEGPTPFEEVVYHLFVAGGGAAACQIHSYAHVETRDVRCATVTPERLARVLEELAAAGLMDLEDQGEPHPLAPRWLVEASFGGRQVAARIRGPALLDDPGPARIIEAVLREVRGATGVEVFRDIFLPTHQLGLVTFWTHPRTEVWVDGVLLAPSTPVLSLDLPVGDHHLRLVNAALGIDRDGRFRVTAGRSTNFLLNVIPNAEDAAPNPEEPLDGTPD
ncbi:MAG: hypothetical protein FJ098_01845 [Deltaproteobacteria bacterium]|nr:hypothetical protein [Deltaproteobacteria bacterium]